MTLNRFSRCPTPLALILLISLASINRAADNGPKERTVTALEQDLTTDPNNAELWLHLGFAYRKLDKVDDAQRAFEKVASLDPHNHDALYMLALIYEKKHQTQVAIDTWKRFVEEVKDPAKKDMGRNHIAHLTNK